MAYVIHTPTEFKASFPDFATVADAVVQEALDEGADHVDQSWDEKDYKLAASLYAAHVLLLNGQGDSNEAQMRGFKSFSIGPLSLTPNTAAGDAPDGSLKSTSYGRRYASLLARNVAPIAVLNSGTT